MNVRVFTLSFSSVLGGFDDGEVREFVKDKEVLAVRDHFFLKDESPYLVLVITYNMLRPEQEISTRKSQVKEGGRDREAWRKTLPDEAVSRIGLLRIRPCPGLHPAPT